MGASLPTELEDHAPNGSVYQHDNGPIETSRLVTE